MSKEFYLKTGDIRDIKENRFIYDEEEDEKQVPGFFDKPLAPQHAALFNKQEALKLTSGREANENKQDGGESWKAFYKEWDATSTLGNDFKTALITGKVKQDSVEMNNVKQAAANLTEFLLNTEISNYQSDFNEQVKEALEKYDQLIRNCDIYYRKKWWGIKIVYHKGEGYRRRKLVQEMGIRAREEKCKLRLQANAFFNKFKSLDEKDERPLWINVIAECRDHEVPLDSKLIEEAKKRDIEKSSIIEPEKQQVGGDSNLIRIESKGKTGYIKEENHDLFSQNRFEQIIEETSKTNIDIDSKLKAKITCEGLNHKDVLRDALTALNNAIKDEQLLTTFSFEDFSDEKKTTELETKIRNSLNKILSGNDNIILRIFLDDGRLGFYESPDVYQLLSKFTISCIKRRKFEKEAAKKFENFNIVNRNIATYRLAKFLGIQDLIPTTIKVKYKANGEADEHHGILMDDIDGDNLDYAITRYYACSNNALKQLNSLQIFDVLTGQLDRNPRNLIIKKVHNISEVVDGVKGINNDMCFGNLSYKDYTLNSVLAKYNEIKPIEDKNGRFNLAIIDKEFYDNVLSLDDEFVKNQFSDLLTPNEISYFLDRIHGVQNLLRRVREGEDLVLFEKKNLNDNINYNLGDIDININDRVNQVRKYQKGSYLNDFKNQVPPSDREVENRDI